jgi:hypothetical protein
MSKTVSLTLPDSKDWTQIGKFFRDLREVAAGLLPHIGNTTGIIKDWLGQPEQAGIVIELRKIVNHPEWPVERKQQMFLESLHKHIADDITAAGATALAFGRGEPNFAEIYQALQDKAS